MSARDLPEHLARAVKIVPVTNGKVDPSVLLGLGLAVEDDIENRKTHHDDELDHEHDDFDSFVLDIPVTADPDALALFPDYLVRLNASTLSGPEQSTLTEILSADLPFKILVQSDDILERSLIEHGHMAFTLRNKQLARMTMGFGMFIMQAPASSLIQMRAKVQEGLEYAGSSVFSIYSGDSPNTAGIPPYLVAAAACAFKAAGVPTAIVSP